MNKLKIVVYAISKNEEKFVSKWYESMKEADEIYVLDTGSTDKTVEKLQELGVHVESKNYDFFRFDNARNDALDLVPLDTDICVSTDLDEVFNPGWRKLLEEKWNNTDRIIYTYNWRLDNDNNPLVTFNYDKIHSRQNYKWIYPVHEVLSFTGHNERKTLCDNIILNHYPDTEKSRNNYLPLLELSVKEYPESDRNMHYLGREYMYHENWNKAIDTLIKHLDMKSSTWNLERAASMRFISRCYIKLNRIREARLYLDMAIKEVPYNRDAYTERAILEYNQKDYIEALKYSLKAKQINKKEKVYMNEIFSWDNTLDNIIDFSLINLNIKKQS